MKEIQYDISDLEPVSACCGADIIYHDICDDCREHCENIYHTEDGILVDEDGEEY
tara:strand:+ start:1147 stop:1311 length:165 start_codon:yes stop_codon:yes gene_type:complete